MLIVAVKIAFLCRARDVAVLGGGVPLSNCCKRVQMCIMEKSGTGYGGESLSHGLFLLYLTRKNFNTLKGMG